MFTQLLMADSDERVLNNCRRYLSNHGYQVEVASDGGHCLDMLRRGPPDILVLERELLWGGGDAVLGWLRERPTFWPETIVLTCCDSSTVPSRCQTTQPPVKAVLRRPYGVHLLLSTVRLAHGSATVMGR